jgi:hypothetical protein
MLVLTLHTGRILLGPGLSGLGSGISRPSEEIPKAFKHTRPSRPMPLHFDPRGGGTAATAILY